MSEVFREWLDIAKGSDIQKLSDSIRGVNAIVSCIGCVCIYFSRP